MRIYNETENLAFANYNLSTLMTLEEWPNRANKVSNNNNVYLLLQDYLRDFGILINGSTSLRNEDGSDTHIKVRYSRLHTQIPAENLAIIPLLYGWDDCVVNIGLRAFDTHSDSVDYHTKSGTCKLLQHVYGSKKVIKAFDSIADLIDHYKKVKQEY